MDSSITLVALCVIIILLDMLITFRIYAEIRRNSRKVRFRVAEMADESRKKYLRPWEDYE